MNKEYTQIKEDLRKLGIKSGDKVMVHSSYKSLGLTDIADGADIFIKALKDTVGESGTLMFPTFTFDYTNANNPVFDIKETRSCVGYLTEVFRKSEGVRRSLHPTHSIAVWGNNRDWFIENHRADSVCVGENSPLFKLKDCGGKILMVGCGIARNTLIHGVECFYKPPYAFKVDYNDPEYHREYKCIDENGEITQAEFFHEFMVPYGYRSDYDKLRGLAEIKEGMILNAESFLMDARNVWDTALNKMKEEPFYFMMKL